MAPDQVPPNNFPNTLANYAIRQYARGMTNTPDASARDDLAEIIDRGEHYFDAGPGYELSATDAAYTILAAGYRKPRTITTVEELGALPDTSVVLDAGGDVSRKVLGGWTTTVLEADGAMWLTDNHEGAELPATVLWEPEA